jgi:putative ABC transport system substrate-binding protein
MFAGVEMFPKMLQVLKNAVPAVSRCTVVVLAPESGAGAPQVFKDLRPMMAASAKALGIELQELHVPTLAQLTPGVRQAKSQGTQALYVWLTPLAFSSGKELADAALANGLPSIHPYVDSAVAGGLLAYAASLDNMARQGAAYVDKILRGAEPAHLPVTQPTKFDLVVNLKTARTLGLTIPPSVLLQADRIIE